MSVIDITKKHEQPLSLYSGTPNYAKSPSMESPRSPSFAFTQSPPPSPLKEKNIIDYRQFLQPDAQLSSNSKEFLFREHILPDNLIKYFAEHPLPSGFHPYSANPHDPIHLQLKKVADYFEQFTQACPTMEKASIAEEITAEIRYAKLITYFKENHTHLTVPEKMLILEEMDAAAIDNPATSVLLELGARYHLACRLFKIQSSLPQTNLTDIASIYNFMTLKNTFVPHPVCLRLAMHANLMGSIASNMNARIDPSISLNDNLKKADQLVNSSIKNLKDMIDKGFIDSYCAEEDRVYIDGQSEETEIPGHWAEQTVSNASISTMLKCAETVFRHNLAKKFISSIASQYKQTYQKTHMLPKEITDTIEKITSFLKLSSETAGISKQLDSCNPSRDLLSGIFGPSPDFRSLLNEAEREAQKQLEKLPILTRILNVSNACDKIDSIKAQKIAAISWAEKQWNSTVPLSYPLPSTKETHPQKPETVLDVSGIARIASPDRIPQLAHPHVSYLKIGYADRQNKDVRAIWQSLSHEEKIDALRHINTWKQAILQSPQRFPVESTILQWLQQTSGSNISKVLETKIAALQKQQKKEKSYFSDQGETLLTFYYTAKHANKTFYPQLMEMIDAFAAQDPDGLLPYLSDQAQAAGWNNFSDEWENGSFTQANTYLHTIQAIERYLHDPMKLTEAMS